MSKLTYQVAEVDALLGREVEDDLAAFVDLLGLDQLHVEIALPDSQQAHADGVAFAQS